MIVSVIVIVILIVVIMIVLISNGSSDSKDLGRPGPRRPGGTPRASGPGPWSLGLHNNNKLRLLLLN